MPEGLEWWLSDRDLDDLNPVSFGYQRCDPGYSFGPFIRSYYLIHYVVSGKGTLYTNDNTFPVGEGQAFLIKPDEATRYEADRDDPWYYIWIGFTGKVGDRFLSLQDRVLRTKTRLFEEMLEVDRLTATRKEFLLGKLWSYFSLLFETEKSDGRNYVDQIFHYIDYNYMYPIKVEDIAKMVNLERHYLSRIFREQTGKTVKQALTEKRQREAETFLARGHSVTETAMLTGYGDMFLFSKAFKKAHGVSPRAFQKESSPA